MQSRSRANEDDEDTELSEINITPFIDIMLVLLIVFMVAAPLSTVDVPIDLPVSNAKPQKRPDKPLFVTIKADRTLAVADKDVKLADLVQTLDITTALKRDTQIFIRADKSVSYGDLMRTLNHLCIGGYLKVALVGLEGTGAPTDSDDTVERVAGAAPAGGAP